VDPSTLKFARTHEWVHVDGDVATVGISDFAVTELTDLVYIELPSVGKTVQPGEMFGEVESVKAVSDLYAPVAGEVIEVNEGLPDSLQLLSEDPGWCAYIIPRPPTPQLQERPSYGGAVLVAAGVDVASADPASVTRNAYLCGTSGMLAHTARGGSFADVL